MSNWYSSYLTFDGTMEERKAIIDYIDGIYEPSWTDIRIEGNELSFRTPRPPYIDVIDMIAEAFPHSNFWYTYIDTCCFSCAGMRYRGGECVFATSGYYGPDPMEEECEHPYVCYEERGTNRLFYQINGKWTEVTENR